MINIENSCCFTGHRPDKSPFPFDRKNEDYRHLVARTINAIKLKIDTGCTVFYTGMARGFDILAGEQVMLYKLLNPEIKLIAVVPFKGFELSWGSEWRERFNKLLSECDEVVFVSDYYHKAIFQQRNEYMVDRCRHVIAFFDGSKGGTANTVKYANIHCREVYNVFDTDPLANGRPEFKAYFKLIPPEK